MKRIITIILLISVGIALSASSSLSQLFPGFTTDSLDSLKSGTTFEAITCYNQSISALAPANSQGMELAIEGESIKSGFSIAALSFIPYPESFAAMTEEEQRVSLFNILRSISTQKGIQYISHMAGDKPATLFEDSYMISNPKDKSSKVADPVSTEVPASYVCYSYQKDNRFGKNVYSISYTINDCDFLMDISNYTTMKYMGFSCVDKGTLHMYLEVVLTQDGFVVYSMASVKDREPEVKILFLSVDLPSAFMRRITALKDWFSKEVNK